MGQLGRLEMNTKFKYFIQSNLNTFFHIILVLNEPESEVKYVNRVPDGTKINNLTVLDVEKMASQYTNVKLDVYIL